jgi:hypothetical protein
MTDRKSVALVALILLISGCGGVQDGSSLASTGVAPETPSVTANDTTPGSTVPGDDGVSVRGRRLPVNATAVFRNVLALTGVDAHQPIILVKNRTAVDGDQISARVVDDFGTASA